VPKAGQDIARIALTFAWSEDVAHPQTTPYLPPADALAQLFYALNILYVATVEPEPERGTSTAPSGRRLHGVPAQWVKIATRLMTTGPTSGNEWPTALLAPRVDDAQALRIESIVMASPLELVLAVPITALSATGIWATVKFVDAIERTWNVSDRIRLEHETIKRDIARVRSETDEIEHRRKQFARDNFELVEGSLQLPGGWDPPQPGAAAPV
jgi:hypothetical protein